MLGWQEKLGQTAGAHSLRRAVPLGARTADLAAQRWSLQKAKGKRHMRRASSSERLSEAGKPPGSLMRASSWLFSRVFFACLAAETAGRAQNGLPSGDRRAPYFPRPTVGEWKREAALRETIKRINHFNSLSSADNFTAIYGINQFSHLFPEEFRAIYLQSRPFKVPKYKRDVRLEGTEKSLPAKFDWRDKNVVTEVKNQETCGGCWAFSVVGGIESAYAIKRNVLEELSAQQVIDCSYNNNGCQGGSTVTALSWMNQTHVKLVKDSAYPFKAETGLCHYFSLSGFGVSIQGYTAHDLSGQEDEMKKLLLEWGPLAVIVDAVSWQDYLGGIIQHHCSSGEANHAVLITGYDTTGSIPYWIVRNSWGRSWGIDGYAHIKMGSNICGIADEVSSVFV